MVLSIHPTVTPSGYRCLNQFQMACWNLLRVAKDALQLLDLARVLHHIVEGPLCAEEILGRAHPVVEALARHPLDMDMKVIVFES